MKSPNLNTFTRLDEWGRGKNPFVVAACVVIAACTDTIVQGLVEVRKGRWHKATKTTAPLVEWLRFYRNPRQLFDAIGKAWGLPEEVSGSELYLDLAKLSSLSPAEWSAELGELGKADFAAATEWGDRTIAAAFSDFLDGDISLFQPDLPENPLDNAALRFLVFVWMPCWFECQAEPLTLLRRARDGDLTALQALLRIDKSVIFDPRIARIVHVECQNPKGKCFANICGAFCDRLPGKVTAKKVKAAAGALIKVLIQASGQTITEPEIRGLFDLVSRHRGRLVDPDISTSPEAYAKAIRRKRPGWDSFVRSDKNHT